MCQTMPTLLPTSAIPDGPTFQMTFWGTITLLKMHLNTGISPCIITPVDDSDNFIYMVLPVRLKAQ